MAAVLRQALLALCVGVLFSGGGTAAWSAEGEGSDRAGAEAVLSLEAYAAYKSGDYATAYRRWLPLAEAGNTSAMINLATLYERGQGVAADPQQALSWLVKAADLGDSRAQFHLGTAYERGDGVPRDPRTAAQWFRKAAEQGDQTAQFNLAVMLATAYGAGREQASAADRAEARAWLEKAAAAGHPDARAFLATLAP